MRKRIGALLLALAVVMTSVCVPVKAAEPTDVVIADTFNDPELQDYASVNYDKNADGILNAEEIAAATELNLANNWYLEDVTGIECLTSLKKIDLTWCWIDSIYVSTMPNLEELILNGTAIDTLDVSNNTALKTLDVQLTYLADLDVSKNAALENLIISVTDIAEIDLSGCKNLVSFEAEDTALTTVDLSNNTKLETVNIAKTDIENVDLSALSELKTFKASESAISTVDVSNNAKLETLNLLAAKNVAALDVSNNTALKTLDISGTAITELSLAANTALVEFNNYDRTVSFKDYKAAPVKGLDISNNTSLEKLFLDGTDLSHMEGLDLTDYPALTKLSLENTGLKSIKFNDDVVYESLYLNGNALKEADRPAFTEKAKAEWGTQNVTAKVPSTDPLETYDLNNLIDIARAEVVPSEDIEYNAETGIITFKGENKVFSYKYNLDESGSYKMDVNVTVVQKTVEEEAAEKVAADKAAAQPVIEMIDAIGDVTLDSEEAIEAAREAYDALTDDQKQYVENYEVLTAAEETLEALKEEAENSEDDTTDDGTTDDGTTDDGTTDDGTTEDGTTDDGTTDDDTDNKPSSPVKTGDTTAIMPYVLAMLISLFIICRRKIVR